MARKKVVLGPGATEIDGKVTFWGALIESWDTLVKDKDGDTVMWNPDTQSQYAEYYNLLHPYFEGPLEEFDQESVEAAIEQIQKKRVEKGQRVYEASTTRTLFRLVRIVVKYAAENELISEDFLWGAGYSLEEDLDENERKAEGAVLRKSLKVEEEIAVVEELLTDPFQVGQKVGLALMLALGVRNNEACGLKYEAIKELTAHPNHHVAYVYQTATEGGDVKAGGKTVNAYRILPLPSLVYEFLCKRREWIVEAIETGTFKLPPEIGSVDELPIANRNENLAEVCKPSDLGKAGKQLFKTIKMSEDQFAHIDKAVRDTQWREEMGIQEKEATAYLLRRNYATHLHILGLTQEEIEYVMGHEILAAGVERNDFENEDLFYTNIYKKLERRPLLNKNFDRAEVGNLIEEESVIQLSVAANSIVHVSLTAGDTLRCRIKSDEPRNKIRMQAVVVGSGTVCLPEVSCQYYVGEQMSRREATVISAYHATYRSAR